MLLIVEGVTDKVFIEMYLKYLDFCNKYEVLQCGGKIGGLEKCKEQLKKAIDKDQKIKIIFDADNDFNAAKNNIEKQLDDLDIDKNNYEIFLLPNNEDNGELETLLEKIAKEKDILKCFDCYVKCIKDVNIELKLPDKKDKIYAYFDAFGYKYNPKLKLDAFIEILKLENDYLLPLKDFLLHS